MRLCVQGPFLFARTMGQGLCLHGSQATATISRACLLVTFREVFFCELSSQKIRESRREAVTGQVVNSNCVLSWFC